METDRIEAIRAIIDDVDKQGGEPAEVLERIIAAFPDLKLELSAKDGAPVTPVINVTIDGSGSVDEQNMHSLQGYKFKTNPEMPTITVVEFITVRGSYFYMVTCEDLEEMATEFKKQASLLPRKTDQN